MLRYIIDDTTLAAIADAIRGKTGEEGPIPIVKMAEYIDNIRTSAKPVLEGLTITPTGKEIVEIPPFGSDGFGIVVVAGDENLIEGNIRNGVTIYGVEGRLESEGGIDTSDATATSDDILDAATAYVNGQKLVGTHVCVADPILSELYVTPTGEELHFTPEGDVDGFGEVIIEPCEELVPENILAGSTIYGVDGTVCFQETEVMPGVEDIVLEPDFGFSAFDTVTVYGDPNLLAKNIVKGVSIFEVEGSALSEDELVEKKLIPYKEVMPSAYDIVLDPSKEKDGEEESEEEDEESDEDKKPKYLGYAEVKIHGDPNLLPENIRKGITIFDVKGLANVEDDPASGVVQDRMCIFPNVSLIWEYKDKE